MLLDLIEEVSQELKIKFEFFNISGGIGIPYLPEDMPFDMPAFVIETKNHLQHFAQKNGYTPRLFMECGALRHRTPWCAGSDGDQPDE